MNYIKGMVMGGIIGASAAVAAGMLDPSLRKVVMKKGHGLARQYKRKMHYLNMF